MPNVHVNGVRLHYEDSGSGKETIVFSHGLLWSCRMFDAQIAALSASYRCVAFDHRGQGQSEIPDTRAIEIEDCYQDAVALIETLKLGPCHFIGLSMGGFVGQRLAARRPDLLRSLVMMCSSAGAEPAPKVRKYGLLSFLTGLGLLPLLVGRVMPIMFGKSFLEDPARAEQRAEWRERLRSHKPSITRAVRGLMQRRSVEDELPNIALPTLILVGMEDQATPPELARSMHSLIPGSRLEVLPRGGHTLSVEEAEAVTAEIQAFLAALS